MSLEKNLKLDETVYVHRGGGGCRCLTHTCVLTSPTFPIARLYTRFLHSSMLKWKTAPVGVDGASHLAYDHEKVIDQTDHRQD